MDTHRHTQARIHIHTSWEQERQLTVLQPGCSIREKQGMFLIRFRAILEKEEHAPLPLSHTFIFNSFTPLQKKHKEVILFINPVFRVLTTMLRGNLI